MTWSVEPKCRLHAQPGTAKRTYFLAFRLLSTGVSLDVGCEGTPVCGAQGVSSEPPKSEPDNGPIAKTTTLNADEPPAMFGSYRAGRLLGEGGMGSVYEAFQAEMNRRAAVKVLHPRFASNRKLVARFLNEARAVNIISHPTVVSVYEYGQRDDGTAYFIMEYIDGETLHHALRKLHGLPMDVVRSMQILRQIASGLAAAHAKVIVHRDLKPTNIMLVKDADLSGGERVKLLDFGIAKLVELDVEQQQSALTAADSLLGTPTYMSPEQCRNPRDVTDRTDVYSLGVIAYEMLTGHQPFRASTDFDTIMRHKQLVPPPASELNPAVPPGLDELIGSMLAKSPMERPAASDIKQRLTLLLQAPALTGEHAPLVFGSVVAPVPSALASSGAHRALAGVSSGDRLAPPAAIYLEAGAAGAARGEPPPTETDALAQLPTQAQVTEGAGGSMASASASVTAEADAQTLVGEGPAPAASLSNRLSEARTAVMQPLPKELELAPAKPAARAGLLDEPTAPPLPKAKAVPSTAMVPRQRAPSSSPGASASSSASRAPVGQSDQLRWVLLALVIVVSTFVTLYVAFGRR